MGYYKNLIFDGFVSDVWTELKSSSLPILIYGMGNGADKIINTLNDYSINYDDVFASDGFVRGHSYRGKVVLSYSQACEKYKDFIILLSFGTHLDDVMNWIYELDSRHELYAPDVPVCEGELFNESFFDENEQRLSQARQLLSDEESRLVFDDIIRFKLRIKLIKI